MDALLAEKSHKGMTIKLNHDSGTVGKFEIVIIPETGYTRCSKNFAKQQDVYEGKLIAKFRKLLNAGGEHFTIRGPYSHARFTDGKYVGEQHVFHIEDSRCWNNDFSPDISRMEVKTAFEKAHHMATVAKGDPVQGVRR